MKPSLRDVQRVQGYLYDYLTPKDGLDPYDFSHYLPEWAKEARVRLREDDLVSDITPTQLKKFTKWLIERDKGADFIEHMPYEAPAYLTFSEVKKLPVGTWGIHFTKADAFEAFDRGATLDGLHLSTWRKEKVFVDCKKNLSEDVGDLEIVYGFAFEAQSGRVGMSRLDVMSHGLSKYGDNAVLFQTDGAVRAWHMGDEEHQMIFPLCSEYNVIPMYNPDPGEIKIETEGGEEAVFDSLDNVIAYVEGAEKREVQANPSRRLIRVE